MNKVFLILIFLFFIVRVEAGDKKTLSVSSYKQKYNLSCEVAAIVANLKYFHIEKSEEEIIALMPIYKKFPQKISATEFVWGDPDMEFVGDYNGIPLQTGYGIYPPALVELLQKMGIQAIAKSQIHIDELIHRIDNNLPSIVWVTSKMKAAKADKVWRTVSGKLVKWIPYEHTMLAIGYDKKKRYLLFLDVFDGKFEKYSFNEFQKAWSYLNNQALYIN